ncbi:MAG: transposase family protein [Deltaproteobacteria bacterium]|nr:transposase family protein [Deltaproteobacteria bacterium]
MGDGEWNYPLTITDASSRFVLACRGFRATHGDTALPWFEKAFREYGVPRAIRTDNGAPFVTKAAGGLSRLSVWWHQLGIRHERIEPGHPEQNGRHERMHRTLKQETTQPPQHDLAQQQKAFEQFVDKFNNERPHEALASASSVMSSSAAATHECNGGQLADK